MMRVARLRSRAYGAVIAVGLSMTACTGLSNWKPGNDNPNPPELVRAEQGDIEAQYETGRYYAQRKRNDEAIYWLCSAAVRGHLDAQLTLARLYEWHGTGTAPTAKTRLTNRGSAYFWYTAAAVQGSDEALLARDALARKMDDARVAEARRRATRWKQARCIRP